LILRDQGANRTIAGGVVIAVDSPRRGRNAPQRVANLKNQIGAGAVANRIAAILESAEYWILFAQLEAQLNIPIADLRLLVKKKPDWIVINQTIIRQQQIRVLSQNLITQIKQWHDQHPNQPGIEISRAIALLPHQPPFATDLLEQLVKQGLLNKNGATLSVKDFNARLSEPAQKSLDLVLPLISADSRKPPVLHDLAKTTRIPAKQLERNLMECVKAGSLVRPVANRFYQPEAVEALKNLITNTFDDQAFTVQEYRDVAGIGRNLAIELLEYFDRQGYTRRNGNYRNALPPKD
jgi:selenocysteine-specific elongation factor